MQNTYDTLAVTLTLCMVKNNLKYILRKGFVFKKRSAHPFLISAKFMETATV